MPEPVCGRREAVKPRTAVEPPERAHVVGKKRSALAGVEVPRRRYAVVQVVRRIVKRQVFRSPYTARRSHLPAFDIDLQPGRVDKTVMPRLRLAPPEFGRERAPPAPVFERDTPHAIGNAFRDDKPFLRGCGGIKPAPAQFHAWHESRGKQRY